MAMIIQPVDGVTLAYDPEDQATALTLRQACAAALPIIRQRWGLPAPENLWVYVMTDRWLSDLLRLAPAVWRVALILALPFNYLRTRRMWKHVGGWQIRLGRRRLVGIKPPRLLLQSDRSIGEGIFIEEPDLDRRTQHLLCHELTHACTAHLFLPAWLNEGLAMLTVDHLVGRPTVKLETLALIPQGLRKYGQTTYQQVRAERKEAVIYLYVSAYWVTRWLEETQPELLKSLLDRRTHPWKLESRLAKALGMDADILWRLMVERATTHFGAPAELI